MRRIYIAGSRKWTQATWNKAYSKLQEFIRSYHVRYGERLEVYTGDAPGVDKFAGYFCYVNQIKTYVYGVNGASRIPVYGTYTPLIGKNYMQRDCYLADLCDEGLFIWNGSSEGTQKAFEYMNKFLHRPTKVWTPAGVLLQSQIDTPEKEAANED